MAIEDYFKGSSQAYGQLAGSLLAGRRKEDKKEAKRALIASTVLSTFGAFQKQQKQSIIDNSNDVKEKYSDIFTNNEELYNLQAGNRAKYMSYVDDKESYLHAEAVKKFNSDAYIKKEFGENAFSSVNKETLDEEGYTKAVEVFESFKKQAEQDIKLKGASPAVSTTTFTKFNELAMQEYRAALAAVEDDPTKKGLIREAFNKIFGEDRDGNKRFGAAEKVELMNARDKIKVKRLNQETKVNAPLTLQEEENVKIDVTSNINSKVNTKVEYFRGTEIPLDYDFKTKKEVLKYEKENFVTKVNTKDYKIKVDDINKAVEFGYVIPGFEGLKNLMQSDRESLVSVAAKVSKIKAEGNNPWDKGLLDSSERSIWMIATNMDLNAREKSDLELQRIHAGLRKDVNSVDYTKVLSLSKDETFTTTVAANVNGLLNEEKYSNIKNLYDEGNVSAATKEQLNTHIIQGALYLQQVNKGMSMGDAINESTKIQMGGFYKFQDDPTKFYNPFTYFNNKTHQHQYVDLNIITVMEQEITSDKQAERIAEYMSTKRYIQNMNNGEFKPDTVGKSVVDGDYKFTVVNISKPNEEEYLIWEAENVAP